MKVARPSRHRRSAAADEAPDAMRLFGRQLGRRVTKRVFYDEGIIAGPDEQSIPVTRRAIAIWSFLKSEPRNQVRTRLAAGGRWIRTLGPRLR